MPDPEAASVTYDPKSPSASDIDRLRARWLERGAGSADEFDAVCEAVRAILAEKPVAKPVVKMKSALAPEPKPVSKSRGARPKMKPVRKRAKARR